MKARGPQKREDIIARDPEAIAYDRCARALAHFHKRLGYDSDSRRGAGRILSMLADRFDAVMPATTLRTKTEEPPR